MSLYGALSSGVSGVNAFSNEMAIRADNISNISTIGYKRGDVDFSTLVSATSASTSGNYASGGVTAQYRATIDTPGTILSSNFASDIAINGTGFFVVNTNSDASGDYLYTRAGSFRNDSTGNYVNSAGYTLLGWPLDNEGRLPGDNGNTNTTPNSLLSSLTTVNVNSITGSASATTTVSIGANLNEPQKILKGSGEAMSFGSSSPANYNISSTDPIAPENSGANILNIGDSIVLTPTDPGTAYTFVYGGMAISNNIGAGILGSTTPQTNFSGATDGDNFTIVSGGTTTTYTYRTSNPISSKGEFNTPETLVNAINQSDNLKARTVSTGGTITIIVAPTDANQDMTFTDVTGTFAGALGFTNTTLDPSGDRFASLSGLEKIINKSSGLSAQISSPLQNAALNFYANNPTGKIQVNAVSAGISTPTSILSEFGLNPTDGKIFGPAYDPSNATMNMAGGQVGAHFTRKVQIFDAFGTGHNVQVSFLKTAINTWAVEIYAQNPSDLASSRTDGQIQAGNISFNGDGSLRSVSSALTSPIGINWSNQSTPSSIVFNWGTPGDVAGTPGALSIGKTDGLRQVDADYNVDFVDQNGIPPGLLTGVTFDDLGNVIASFSNGSTRKVFQLPIAEFANPNGLENKGGNAYAETNDSGNFNLKTPGAGGAGKVAANALEQSNVDLADELTSIIITQRNYQSASKIIKISDSMLEDLNRLIS